MSGLPPQAGGGMTLGEAAAAMSGELLVGEPGQALGGVTIDSRTARPGDLFFAIRGPRFDGHDFLGEAAERGAAAAVVERAVVGASGLGILRVVDSTRALADLARHVRRGVSVPVVAVTGSSGKTTTKEMIATLLEARGPVLKTEGNLNNRYGLPLTLCRLRGHHTAAVLELGMSAPGELRELAAIAQPDVAVVINVAPVHLEFFESIDAIAEAKAEILEGLRPDGTAVLNGDDPRVRRFGERFCGRVVFFGRSPGSEITCEAIEAGADGTRLRLRIAGEVADAKLPLLGEHFASDFLAAAGAAHALGLSVAEVASGAGRVRPAPHRGEVLRLRGGVTLIDDCYNSNPAALSAALRALALAGGRRRVAVLGDMLELGPSGPELHRRAGEDLAGRADLVVAVGPLARSIVEGARHAGLAPELLHHFPDAAVASVAVPSLLDPGDAVLVKGSRGVRLETVASAIAAELAQVE
jgi:UDP-N-acetylmuramoyl-tripeptide--D-alanyl-D-alanine ligase